MSEQKLNQQGIELSVVSNDSSVLKDSNESLNSGTPTTPSGKKASKYCSMNDCKGLVAKVIGDCRFCQQRFCSKHRLPESHQCENLDHCRKASFDKNAGKLLNEKCVASRV
ncbi:hypothetical protein BKA69DRAFT_1030132 [Paraphysoderma sedebokerense]|nr:hypothetical protein BKA69DRAFT_1030132 [Paraphysoderma sedebokerense]